MKIASYFRLALAALLIGASPSLSITGQLLSYQDGYIFFTSGNGFKASPNLRVIDNATKQPAQTKPAPRQYARAIFNDDGEIVELDLAKNPFPLEPLTPATQRFVVAASPSYPDPDLAPKVSTSTTRNGVVQTFSGKLVLLNITVQVPPNTPASAQIYMATDTTSWNPQAIALVRIDALHFRVTQRFASGTILHYIYTRGSMATEERAENGLDVPAHSIIVSDADVRAVNDIVYRWADQSTTNGAQIQPNVAPTPYNPNPFPNLPSVIPTPHP